MSLVVNVCFVPKPSQSSTVWCPWLWRQDVVVTPWSFPTLYGFKREEVGDRALNELVPIPSNGSKEWLCGNSRKKRNWNFFCPWRLQRSRILNKVGANLNLMVWVVHVGRSCKTAVKCETGITMLGMLLSEVASRQTFSDKAIDPWNTLAVEHCVIFRKAMENAS